MLTTLALAFVLLTQPQATPAALHVVVIAGEDAVNIIQQKTAVKPVVEVRDRNNLPVSGALVTFTIEGGKAATFGGASTMTVATNAAGQAAVSSLSPAVSGAFQINVSAAFQGQIATATIAQTNVLTAAQAAAAAAGANSAGASAGTSGGAGSAGGAGGAAGGAGGGISTTALVATGAAVAGGAVAATQIADKAKGDGETEFMGTFSGTISGTLTSRGENCSFVYSITGATARLRFTTFTDSSVSGKYDYQGPSGASSSTCSPGATPPIPQFIGEVEVTGSPSNFSGRNVIQAPAGGPSGQNVYSFQGSVSGNTATGTFTYEQSNSGDGGGGSVITVNATGTFPITFQKK